MPLRILRNWRRRRIQARPFPATWEPHLQGLPFFRTLSEDEQTKLRGLVQVFIEEKNFEGCAGLKVDHAMRVCIAAQACLLILHLDHHWYRGVRSILIYPSSFRSNFEQVSGPGVVGPPPENPHAGEAWLGGAVILAWDRAFEGGRNGSDGRNTVFHEFAHKLDMLDGHVDGAPPAASREQALAWREIATHAFSELQADAQRGRRSLLDHYGATSPAEFFAVATEVFFEQASALKKRHPEVYACLQRFYRQDPAARERG